MCRKRISVSRGHAPVYREYQKVVKHWAKLKMIFWILSIGNLFLKCLGDIQYKNTYGIVKFIEF